jgi:hypothetical protein
MIEGLRVRLKAFSIHFLISAVVFLVFFYLVFAWWYPEPYLTLEGGWAIVTLIVLVDVVVGPSMTFVVFKPGKKGLKFDLSLIAGVQICALIYGVTVIYNERPQFLVFSVDRFVLVSSNDVEMDKIKYQSLKTNKGPGPLPVYAHLPQNHQIRSKLIEEVMQGKPDLEFRAEYYEPMDNHLSELVMNSASIEVFRTVSEEYQKKIDQFIERKCKAPDKCAYFPAVGKEKSMMLVLQRENGSIVGAIDIDPWISNHSPNRANKKTSNETRG